MRIGILFVMAWWSGSSIQAFRELTKVVAAIDPNGEMEFVVVDTDGCPELYQLPEFVGHLNGMGETAWIKNGRIVATSGVGYNPEWFERNTWQLLG